MNKFELVVSIAAVVFVAFVLTGFWSLVHYPHCGLLTGYTVLGIVTGLFFTFSRWYRELETWGVLFAILFTLVMWYTYINPQVLLGC